MRARGLPDPGTPTKQQVEEHELALLPFRPWCPDSVQGQAQGAAHRRQDRGDQRIPTISFDHGSATELTKQEGTQGDKREELRVLVVKDERTKTLFAHAVEQKGIDSEEYAVKQVAKDIEKLGYRHVTVKCGQKPCTMALLCREDTHSQDTSVQYS